MLLEYTEINIYTINLEKGKQPSYGHNYSLGPVELETLKIYIKTNLAKDFIYPSKSLAGGLILFKKKLNKNFWLHINYWGFNNIIIKNWYLLPLISKFFHCLGHTE